MFYLIKLLDPVTEEFLGYAGYRNQITKEVKEAIKFPYASTAGDKAKDYPQYKYEVIGKENN